MSKYLSSRRVAKPLDTTDKYHIIVIFLLIAAAVFLTVKEVRRLEKRVKVLEEHKITAPVESIPASPCT